MRSSITYLALFLLLAASCSRNGTGTQSSEVNFTIALPRDSAPEAMRMATYLSSSGSYAGDVNLTGNVDGNVFKAGAELRRGSYDAFCYNADTPDTFAGTGKDKAGLYFYTEKVTSDILERYGYAGDRAVFHTPDVVYGASFASITVDGRELSCSSEASPLVETWTIQVKGKGLQYAQDAGVVLSGLPTTCHPFNADADACGELWTKLVIADNQVRGTFNVFKGTCAPKQSLVLNILDSKGKSHLFPLDCTGLMAESRANGTMLINPKASINVPEPEKTDSGGGFQPTMGEWNQQSGEIII
ncbi:MAG: DUF5119 domain-containing protein [Bacteroidales bacterium]|nr:DUF5119 domain-containing protein [Bacteroidales bacterium]